MKTGNENARGQAGVKADICLTSNRSIANHAKRLLGCLDAVRNTSPSCWMAKCPAHDDHSPSLSIRELPDGRVLLHCFAGCEPLDVLGAVDLTFSDLFPNNPSPEDGPVEYSRTRQPFPAADILKCLEHELIVALLIVSSVARGEPIAGPEAERLALVAERVSAALDVGGLRHAA